MANDNEDDPLGGDSFHPKRPWDPEVGYGRPPKAAQFKPGQSGNPNGRPKGAKTVLSEKLGLQRGRVGR